MAHMRDESRLDDDPGSFAASSRGPASDPQSLPPVGGARRVLYLAAAALFFALSIVGVMLPGVPTVPFVLLTSFFLLRSSPKLNALLLRSRTFGPMLRDWNEHHAVRPRVKLVSFAMVAATVGLSLALVSMSSVAKISIALLAFVGLTVICRLPTLAE